MIQGDNGAGEHMMGALLQVNCLPPGIVKS